MKHSPGPAGRRLVVAAGLMLAAGFSAEAATSRWTGLGLTGLWSDADNWDGLRVPADGDALVFGSPTGRPDNVFDLSRSFASMTFAADTPAFAVHVQGGNSVLAFDGIGIRNGSAGSSPLRQNFYADGGSIVFKGQAGINLGDANNLRPVNVTARVGGHLMFQDDAATSGSTFDQLRAEGAAAASGVGGDISFRGRAVATRTASITVTGGTTSGGAGAQASFSELARADSIFNVLAGENQGGGARTDFSGHAVASVYASIYNQGAATSGAAAQAITSFRGEAKLAGSANNEAAAVAGGYGGQLEFRDGASHDTSGLDPALGIVLIRNGGASVAGARSGGTVFRDDSFVTGSQLLIINAVQGEGAAANAAGGTTDFMDRARAGQASLINEGAATSGAGSGATRFSGQASADGASIVNSPGAAAGTLGGATVFSSSAFAGNVRIDNNARSSGTGGSGGTTHFADDANAQLATIDNFGGLNTVDNGSTRFSERASAGQARIQNLGGQADSAFGGVTSFDGLATAGAATLVMAGGGVAQALGGFAVFHDDASAGTATLALQAANVPGATGGRALFFDGASAGAAHFSIAGSPVNHVLGSEGGAVSFAGVASAGNASVAVGGNLYGGAGVGKLDFGGGSTAANATITLAAGQDRGGALSFEGQSDAVQASAGQASIRNQGSSSGAARGLAIGGQTTFGAYASAGNATITNEAGQGAGITRFFAGSTAGDASINNLGGAAAEDGGSTQFSNASTAGRAVITNRAGERGASGFDGAGLTRFVDQASAGQARITAAGGSSGSAVGGLISFADAANPATSILVAEGGSNGGAGGRIRFAGLTNANQARVTLNAGEGPVGAGELDLSALSVAGVAIGSLDGGGTVSLGGKKLMVWSNVVSQFVGLLRDGGIAGGTGGSLAVSGGATVTLAGSNSYTGGTQIGDGLSAGSGKLVVANTGGSATGSGEVFVQRGGTLAGSGFIDGPVTLMDGGVIAPGDPVTLSLNGDLTWNGGGVIRLVVGADAAGSDHLVTHRLVRGSGSAFMFDLVDDGRTPGRTYDLLQFDSLSGFTAGDFSFSGLAGTVALVDGRIAFTTSAVPEPGLVALWLMGLLAVRAASRAPVRRLTPPDTPRDPTHAKSRIRDRDAGMTHQVTGGLGSSCRYRGAIRRTESGRPQAE